MLKSAIAVFFANLPIELLKRCGTLLAIYKARELTVNNSDQLHLH